MQLHPGRLFCVLSYRTGAVFHEIGGLKVCDVQFDGQRVLVIGFRNGKAAALGCVVKAAHVPADRHGLLDLQLHEPLDEEDALLAVAVGEQVLYAVGGHFFPLAGDVVLPINIHHFKYIKILLSYFLCVKYFLSLFNSILGHFLNKI